MLYGIGLSLSLAAGFLIIRLWTGGTLVLVLQILLGLALGLGIDGTAAFYAHLIFNQFNPWFAVGIVAGVGLVLAWRAKPSHLLTEIVASLKNTSSRETILGLCTLGVLALPLAVGAHYYPLGGWDAWSCWNLKAKFIYLGQDHWKDMFGPGLWRSNTHYPLLWPLINVWFFDLAGHYDQQIIAVNSIIVALLSAGVLLFGLLALRCRLWPAIASAVLVTALPLNVTLYTSQYSDSLLGLYLLCALVCLLLAEHHKTPSLKVLGMVFLGLMSFTKNEGLIAAGIVALLVFWEGRGHKKALKAQITALGLALLPTILFMLFIAPKNEAFINGLGSGVKPSNWTRLTYILVFPWLEFVSAKWNGFWLLTFAGLILSGRKSWQKSLKLIGLSLILYLTAVLLYYHINTFFEIKWWLSQTLFRILFALAPTMALWAGLAICA